MVDYFVTHVPVNRYVTKEVKKAPISFDPNVTVDSIAVEQMKDLLSSGDARQLRDFLLKTFDEFRDLPHFNMMLLSAGPKSEEHNVNMDVILKSVNEFPIVRLNDCKGDFCVLRFDRQRDSRNCALGL
jgi:hypothetical protein